MRFNPILGIFSLLILVLSCSQRTHLTQPAIQSQDPVLVTELQQLAKQHEAIDRMMIYDAALRLEVAKDKAPDLHLAVNSIAKKHGGYLLKMQKQSTEIRVPSERMEEAIIEIEALAKVVSKDIRGVDITEQYQDLTVRLDTAEKTRQRYIELLAMAKGVSQALAIEKELERLNVTIERLKGKMNRLQHLDAYATVTIETQEKLKPGPLGYLAYGVVKVVGKLFVWN
ncbi:MAG: DUF4349 domain-containing protein [Calditrichia bacterium]